MTKTDGSSYEGQWEMSVRQGQGKYLMSNGDLYEGEFRDNLSDGQGKMTM